MTVRAHFAQHPAAQTPHQDSVIWRYVSFPKLVSLLDAKALFFARRDRLGDPFEGTFPTNNLDPSYEAVSEVVGDHIAHAKGEKERPTQKYLESVRAIRDKTLVNCWYASEHESAAMWGLYGGDEGAVCIKSTVKRLILAMHHEGAKPEVLIGAVRYLDYTSGTIPMGNLLHAFWTKRISFAHEREVRALLLEHPAEIGELVKVDLETLVEAVYVAPAAKDWLVATVTSALRQFGMNMEAQRSSMDTAPIL